MAIAKAKRAQPSVRILDEKAILLRWRSDPHIRRELAQTLRKIKQYEDWTRRSAQV